MTKIINRKITRASTVVHGYQFWQCDLTKNESMVRLQSTSRNIEIHVWVCVDLHVKVSDLQSWVLVLTYMYSPFLTYKSMCWLTCMRRCFDLHVQVHVLTYMLRLTCTSLCFSLQVWVHVLTNKYESVFKLTSLIPYFN